MGPSFLFLQALFLGILQGLTEFLPISSSAHLILIPWFLKWDNPLIDSLTFDLALHAGTLLAILGYFWKDWIDLIGGFFTIIARGHGKTFQERLVVFLILSSLPAAFAGIFFQKWIESSFRSPALIVLPLILVSLLMIFAEWRAKRSLHFQALTLKDSFMIGMAQALALLPGVSRSGITITAGLLCGYEREAATRFSFLLSTPIIAGAALFQLSHLSGEMLAKWPIFAVGFVSSGLVGYLSIAFLLRYLKSHTLNIFAGYRLVLAGAVIIWFFGKG